MHHKVRTASLGVLGALLATALLAQSPLSLQSDGIQYPDGTLQTTADPRRAFYLTNSEVTGIGAPVFCDSGYHFASLWEILDVSNLRYATENPNAYTKADSGQGPPSFEYGWVRTGSNAGTSGSPGFANCNAWTNLTGEGSAVSLYPQWDDQTLPLVDWLGPWHPLSFACNVPHRVWCVQD